MTAFEFSLRLAAIFLLCFLLSLGLTWLLQRWLLSRQILDRPNERSSHKAPTPRGGGIAVLVVLLPAWAIIEPALWPQFLGALALAVVGWWDDLRGISPWPRLAVQSRPSPSASGSCGRWPMGSSPAGCCPALRRAAGRLRLALVHQSVQFHGRNRRHRRQRGGEHRLRPGGAGSLVRRFRRPRPALPGAGRRGAGLPLLELASRPDFPGGCRLPDPWLSDRIPAPAGSRRRRLGGGHHPAALFLGRCDLDPAAPGRRRGEHPGGPCPAFLPAEPATLAAATIR